MLGSLSTLSKLGQQAASRQTEAGQARAQRLNHRQQSDKIQRLKQQRDNLLQALSNKTTQEERRQNGETEGEREGETGDGELSSALTYLSELKEKLQVYKMTGVSVVKTDADSKTLCFTTSHRGVYLQSYHLKLIRLRSGSFKVAHHDLPPFVVCSALPNNLRVDDMMSAVRPLQETLTMFVLRREDLKEAQVKLSDHVEILETSAAVDHVTCRLVVSDDVTADVTLHYADLNHYLPSTVKTVLFKQGSRKVTVDIPQELADSVHITFCSQRLTVALTQALSLLHSFVSTRLQ